MFGYILPEKPEMKIKDYELFRAYYCGVCKSIGKRHGQIKRLSLNYDSAFLSLLLSSLAAEKADIRRERCIVHPFSKRSVGRNSSAIDYISDMNVVLSYYKLMDDWRDESSVLSWTALLIMKRRFRKLKKIYGEKCAIIENRLDELAFLEKSGCCKMDEAAEPFAKLMEEIVAYKPSASDEKTLIALKWLGYNIGKWIYIIDAYDDIEDDVKKGSYNVLVKQFEFNNESISEFRERIKERVEFSLVYSLSQIGKAYELLDIRENSAIIENIIYMGMLRKTETILGIGRCNGIEKSI